jgi:pilus assembly protein Flp/PilA
MEDEMTKIKDFAKRFWKDESGVTAIEYGVLGVLIIGAVAAAVGAFSGSLTTAFTSIGTKLTAVGTPATPPV